ncbi:MAG TPA: DUF1501 domain-containing protein [Verrucomicrobiae bacterium]|nr:DUF1501 domain-containing protein [Verrucomicrobiae bacterium]
MNLNCGCHHVTPVLTRRELLRVSAAGFGYLALASLLNETGAGAGAPAAPVSPLAVKPPPRRARAKRVIFLFMHGGPSQVDTFDYKPLLQRDHGRPLPFPKPRVFSSPTGTLLKSPWAFRQYGQSGAWVSDLFPHVARVADDLCFLKGMHGSNSRHGGALLELHTGSDTFVRPSLGSWVSYGLGTENQDLPAYITICPTLTHGGVNAYSSAFLPAVHQGTPMGNAGTPSDQALIPFIRNADNTPLDLQRIELDLLREMNTRQLALTGPDAALEGRINSFELAFRMQLAAPELQDLSRESPAVRKLYGLDDAVTANFGRQCLMARRFAEAGVRFVQATHSYKWDQHSELRRDHARNASEVDQPIAALLHDLKARGLLEETLVLWGGEFGRTPVTELNGDGRDHNPQGYTMWLAGGGTKPGFSFGETDEYGYFSVKDQVHVHDLHATMLYLLGLDHERLTFRYAGRDFRLTDVQGRVVEEVVG